MAIVPAASPSYADVSFAVSAANTGDTVTIPFGSATWGSGELLTVLKDISIIGAGMDETQATPRNTVATIIRVTNTTGKAITYTFQGTGTTCRVSGIVFELTTYGTNTRLLSFNGRCYRTSSTAGGLRVDHIRYRNVGDTGRNDYTFQAATTSVGSQTLPGVNIPFTFNVVDTTGFASPAGQFLAGASKVTYTGITATSFTGCASTGTNTVTAGTSIPPSGAIGENAGLVSWAAGQNTGNYITGSYDHNFVDYIYGSSGSEVHDFANIGSPTGTVPDKLGQYNWSQDYAFGGGDSSELRAIYVEDNIIHRGGFAFGTVGGGANLVFRHNTTWAAVTEHGTDSGANMGPPTVELYNNYIDVTRVAGTTSCSNTRGAAYVSHNNRFTNNEAGGVPAVATQTYRPGDGSFQSGVFGPATGRNFFDKNERGTINVRGHSYVPVVSDTGRDIRLGSIYAQGTVGAISSGNYTLTGVDGTIFGADTWKSFVLVNTTKALAPESLGEQGTLTTAQKQCYALIKTSTNASNTVVTLTDTAGLVVGNSVQIFKVNQYFCHPGAGKIVDSLMNGGSNATVTACSFLTADGNGNFKYFPSQIAFGVWQKGNLSRPDRGTAWNIATQGVVIIDAASPTQTCYPGAFHDEALPSARNTNGTGTAYPTAASQDAAHLRIGADYQAPGTDPTTGLAYAEGLTSVATGHAVTAYGAVYPNPMVSGTVISPPVINSSLTASSTTGTGFTYQITATNSPTSFSADFMPSGFSVNATGLISCLSSANIGQPGTYNISISALNSAGGDTKTLVLTLSGIIQTPRGKGRAGRIATMGRRF